MFVSFERSCNAESIRLVDVVDRYLVDWVAKWYVSHPIDLEYELFNEFDSLIDYDLKVWFFFQLSDITRDCRKDENSNKLQQKTKELLSLE